MVRSALRLVIPMAALFGAHPLAAEEVRVVEYLVPEVTTRDAEGKALARVPRAQLPALPARVISVGKNNGLGIAEPASGATLYLDVFDIRVEPKKSAAQICSMLGANRTPADRVQAGVMGIGPGCR